MENLLDLTNQVEAQPLGAVQATAAPELVENATTTQHPEEVESEAPREPSRRSTRRPRLKLRKRSRERLAKAAPYKREEPPPNPLLLDPYEWDQCTITVGYSLLPGKKVSVSVHNHKDDPIIKEFPVGEVPLPEKISQVMATLQTIWPTSPVSATVVLLPKPENAPERSIIASVRVSQDTPIVQEGVESNLPFPAPIVAMLEELKALMPERALKNIERNAKEKTVTAINKPSRQVHGIKASHRKRAGSQ